MRTPSAIVVWGTCAAALALWGGVALFTLSIDARQTAVAAALRTGEQDAAQRTSANAAIALAAATAGERATLEEVVNRDILTLSDLVGQAGQDAGVSLTIVSVTPGPGPKLAKGSLVHPSSVIFSVTASGSFAQLLTAETLLEDLPVASTVESVQFSRGDAAGVWNMNMTIGIITGSSISS